LAASFYSSPLIGATTTLACFAHEIPHEIADYSILIRSGFTKRQAMQSQFLTAVGAFVSFIVPYTLDHYRCPRAAYHFTPLSFVAVLIFPSHFTLGWVSLLYELQYRKEVQLVVSSTFMGIAIHNLSASTHVEDVSLDLVTAVRQTAGGLLGTTVLFADLVRAQSMLTRYRL